MAIGPIGSAIIVNQMTPAVTPVQGGQYTRFELQNVAAQAAVNEKKKEIEELRPAEENQAIDPDREHNRQEADEEMSQNRKRAKRHFDSNDERQEEMPEMQKPLLDIKV
jgi:hypothetical protein